MGSLIANERGVITLQFLIVLIIVLFFIFSFLGLSLTLVNGSAVQYLTYSSARKLSLGDTTLDAQQEQAELQYSKLREKLFKDKYVSAQDWFQISATPRLGFNESYTSIDRSYRYMFYGASAKFLSIRTNFKIPFLTDEDDGELSTTISSYLGREVTKAECENFNSIRMAKICAIYKAQIGGGACESPQVTLGDNGC